MNGILIRLSWYISRIIWISLPYFLSIRAVIDVTWSIFFDYPCALVISLHCLCTYNTNHCCIPYNSACPLFSCEKTHNHHKVRHRWTPPTKSAQFMDALLIVQDMQIRIPINLYTADRLSHFQDVECRVLDGQFHTLKAAMQITIDFHQSHR